MDCIHTDMVTSAVTAVSALTPATGALPPLVSIVAAVNSALGPRYQVIKSVESAATHVWDEGWTHPIRGVVGLSSFVFPSLTTFPLNEIDPNRFHPFTWKHVSEVVDS